MEKQVRSRAATANDFSFAWQLYSSSVRPFMQEHIMRVRAVGWNELKEEALFQGIWDLNKALVLEMDGVSIGWASIDTSENTIRLENIYIAENYRGHGLGTAFMKWLINQYEGRPFLTSVISNSKSHTFYQHLGFERDRSLGFETLYTKN